MNKQDKPLIWLHGEIKSPPFSSAARIETGYLFRLLQKWEKLALPHSRPMTVIGAKCHELRINMKKLRGELFTELTLMQLLFLKFLARKLRRHLKK